MVVAQNELVSIIVPVYNAEQYLGQCFQSIADQTYTNIDVVVVDDGSTDRSAELCDEWAKKDSRFHITHQSNQGVGAARNKGLACAEGDYIAWVDSDDWIEPDWIEQLYIKIEQYQADMVSINRGFRNHPEQDMLLEHKAIFKNDNEIGRELWSSFTRQEIFQGLVFRNFQIGEDACFLTQARTRCNKVVLCYQKGYHYRINDNSLVHSFQLQSMYSWVDSLEYREEIVRKECPEYVKYMHWTLVIDAASMIRFCRKYRQEKGGPELEWRIKKIIAKHIFRIRYSILTVKAIRDTTGALKCLLLG